MSTKWKPFKFLFEKVTPEEFACKFERETMQTRAFLLSFSPNSEYVEAVMDIYKNQEFADLLTKYLSRVEGDGVDISFIKSVEKHLRGIIGRTDKVFSRKM